MFAFVDVGKSTSSRLRFPECLSRLFRFFPPEIEKEVYEIFYRNWLPQHNIFLVSM